MNIRSLRKGDSEKVLELVKKCGPFVAPYNVYAYWILENYYYSTCKVAEVDKKIIGFISGMPSIDKKCIFIWQICIDEEYRKQGIAGKLLDALFNSAKEQNLEYIELSISDINNTSMNLFKKYSKDNNYIIREKEKEQFGKITEIIYQIKLD